jgi:trans-aconitate 2-methyltransferase
MAPTTWDPDQYQRFAAERAQPFHDLLALVEPDGIGRAVDLGCGTGELTALAAAHLGLEQVATEPLPEHTAPMVGIDTSPTMLAAAAAHASDTVRFEEGDIAEWTSAADHDLVLAAASLHWVPDHPAVLRRWTAALAPGGQLAVQVPANADAPSHVVAAELAASEPYRSVFGPEGPPPDPVAANVLAPERYAELLYELGFARQHVRMTVYPHVLPSSRHVVEWVRGTTLTRFAAVLPPEVYAEFLRDYEDRLLEVIGRHEPHFFPFRRIFLWGRLPDG